jgi:phasin family protein
MTQFIPQQWLSMESNGFDQLFGLTSRYCNAFERLSALNLQAVRFGIAETQEGIARTCAADNLPEVLCLPTLLAPVAVAQALSYSRQFFEIISDLQRDCAPAPVGAVRQGHQPEDLLGDSGTRSLVPGDGLAGPTLVAVQAAKAVDAA